MSAYERIVFQGVIPVSGERQKLQLEVALSQAKTEYINQMFLIYSYMLAAKRLPYATGAFFNSGMQTVMQSTTVGGTFTFYAGFSAPHSKYAIEGRGPGRPPPISRIEAWMGVKGITPPPNASQVVWSIAHKGTKAWRTKQYLTSFDDLITAAVDIAVRVIAAALRKLTTVDGEPWNVQVITA